MDLHFLSDEQGKHTAVVIPIEDWNNITAKHKDLKVMEEPKKSKKPSDFAGCISKDLANKMIADIALTRKQWERNT
jgi:hypothetical protein